MNDVVIRIFAPNKKARQLQTSKYQIYQVLGNQLRKHPEAIVIYYDFFDNVDSSLLINAIF